MHIVLVSNPLSHCKEKIGIYGVQYSDKAIMLLISHSFPISLNIILKLQYCPNSKLQMLKKKCGWVSGMKMYQLCSNGQIIQLWFLHTGIRMNQKFLLTTLLTVYHIQAR